MIFLFSSAIILIINNESYSDDKRDRLHDIAIKSIIKRSVKQIAIEKNDLLKFDKKDLVMYIYAGKPSQRYQQKFGTEARIQLNDKFADVSEVQSFIYSERDSKREELIPYLTTALKVDKETNMGLVSDIKQELRKAEALKINYTTVQGDATTANQ